MHAAPYGDVSAPSNEGFLVPVSVYFDDLDPMGRLHNSRYQTLVERAWIAFWRELGFGGERGFDGDSFHVVKAFSITYENPVTAFGEYAVHAWIETLGTTSATAGYRVCSPDGHTTHAWGSHTVVRIDEETLLPVPWSASFRDVAQSLKAPRTGGGGAAGSP